MFSLKRRLSPSQSAALHRRGLGQQYNIIQQHCQVIGCEMCLSDLCSPDADSALPAFFYLSGHCVCFPSGCVQPDNVQLKGALVSLWLLLIL